MGTTGGGWIKLYRSTLGWRWYDDPITLAFWIYCLLNAAYEPRGYHKADLNVGEFSASLAKMASDTGLTVEQVRSSIDKLVGSQEITKEIRNGCTVIKVARYAEYQGIGTEGYPNEIPTNSQANTPAVQQASNTAPSLYRKEKRRKKKEYIPPISPKGDKKQEGNEEEEVKPFDPYDPNCPKSDKPFDPEDPTTWNIYV